MVGGSASFGEAVRAHRVRAGLTQPELARRAGVSVRALRYIEQGQVSRPRRESVRRLAEAVGLPDDGQWSTGDTGAGGLGIGVLGRLELWLGAQPVDLGPLKQRCLLALLAVQPNQVVAREEIIDLLWGTGPPESCHNLVHTYISRLRRVAAFRAVGGSVLISLGRGGYRLAVDADQLDLLRFDELAGRAVESRRREPLAALVLWERALGLWRGPVLADLPDRVRHHPVATAVSDRRVAAVLAYADTALGLCRYEAVVEQLRALVHEEPLHEGLHSRLMLGLAGSGQQAAALRLFADLRTRLAEDLGIEPGHEVVAAHLRIIRNEMGAGASAAGPMPLAASHPTPAHLPADIGAFTGRQEHLERLDAVLGKRNSTRNAAMVIAAITGTAGVGKTALAVHWARKVIDHFPDGQLWINLRGYDADQPMVPEEALTVFLRALGVPGAEIPLELASQIGLYRTLLSGRRVLVMLDNASGANQVRPLLPGDPGCFALITSRDDLPGLVARDGAARVRLGPLDRRDSVRLLRRLLTSDRADADLDSVTLLSDLCAGLPLALRVAADRVSKVDRALRQAVAELAAEPRLDVLAAENDPHAAARTVFSWSYRALPRDAAMLFRRLGLVPGASWDAHVAAALLNCALSDARRLLGMLAVGNLIEESGGRFQMHDLLRAYAVEQVQDEDSETDRRATLNRIFDYYLGVSASAMDVAFPQERHRRPRVPTPATSTPDLGHPSRAMAWLDVELGNLIAVNHAADNEWTRYSTDLAATLHRYLGVGAHFSEAITIHSLALRAAQKLRDERCEAIALNNLGSIQTELGRYKEALASYRLALTLAVETRNRGGEAQALGSLGSIYRRLGRYDEAFEHQRRTLAIRREINDRVGEGHALNNLGTLCWRLGRYDESSDYLHQALVVRREMNDYPFLATSLNNLGTLSRSKGDHQQAFDYYQRALSIARRAGHRAAEAYSLDGLGHVHEGWGRYAEALDYAQRALSIATEIGKRTSQIDALISLGKVYRRLGDAHGAAEHYRQALTFARKDGDPYEQARALDGLAKAHHMLGERLAAQQCWEAALTTFTGLNVPEAEQVRDKLAALDKVTR